MRSWDHVGRGGRISLSYDARLTLFYKGKLFDLWVFFFFMAMSFLKILLVLA